MPSQIYALIMAGGTGSRLWPRSRTHHPKQFLDITGDLTMLQQAQERILPVITPDRTLVATNASYVDIVRRQLPDVPHQNILGEPIGRGTAAAIGFSAIHLRKMVGNPVMAVLTADHLILKTDIFRDVLQAASHIASEGWLVTLGIQPGYPETGYGYIERGDFLGNVSDFEGYRVARFVEKPSIDLAEKYVSSGRYDWNSGMFIWRVSRILEEMAEHMPALYEGLIKIEAALGTPEEAEVIEAVFPELPSETIDYGIMEKAQKVAVLPVDIGWNDVGSWSAVYDVLPKDPNNNVVLGKHVSPDTRNTLIYSPKRLVATIGLDDVVIVDTDDVLLVCNRSRAQEVRRIVDILKNNGDSNYLHGVSTPKSLTWSELAILEETANELEWVLVSLLLHAGLWPSVITQVGSDEIDLIHGWVATPDGKRPLPDTTREAIYSWMQKNNTLKFSFADNWSSSEGIREALEELGRRSNVPVTVDILYETLARGLFEASDEGQAIRTVLGNEADLVRVPLHALFPFSMPDFSGSEDSTMGHRAKEVLNRAVVGLNEKRS
jgi:mannose-1-phosphate guanylyltransferase